MRYATLKLNDIANCPGVGVSFFTQGCPHKCHGCFNPETWDFDGGIEFTQQTLSTILEGLIANGIQRGLNILGGEPLCPENTFLVDMIITTVKQQLPQTKIYIWSGYTYEELQELAPLDTHLQHILKSADFLIDGRYVHEQRDITLKMRGSRNQNIWNLKTQEKEISDGLL